MLFIQTISVFVAPLLSFNTPKRVKRKIFWFFFFGDFGDSKLKSYAFIKAPTKLFAVKGRSSCDLSIKLVVTMLLL